MVGVQAATNVLVGERYKNISKEIIAYIKGEYGNPPGTIDPDLIKKVMGDEKPITGRYAEGLAPGMEQGKKDAGPLARNVDDVLSYIVFPQIAEKFFESRQKREENKVRYTIEKVG
jgi:oxaloacetate decarboxylase alpha subunit